MSSIVSDNWNRSLAIRSPSPLGYWAVELGALPVSRRGSYAPLKQVSIPRHAGFCHPERSEGSRVQDNEIPRLARSPQDDSWEAAAISSRYLRPLSLSVRRCVA